MAKNEGSRGGKRIDKVPEGRPIIARQFTGG